MGRFFCFGYGYSAQFLAQRLRQAGWSVAGTVRPPVRETDKVKDLRAQGDSVYFFDSATALDNPRAVLQEVTHVLVSIPPGPEGDLVLARHRDDLAKMKKLQWLGYLSTTGVYGTRDGGTVTEDDPLRPSLPRSRARAEAEAQWLQLWRDDGVPVHLFRLAGIYGPGRNIISRLRAGQVVQRIDRPGQVFSRIHVADIATVLLASVARPRAGGIYNVCDDAPEEPSVVTAYACQLLGLPLPPLVSFADAKLSPMARSFWQDNKRVDNRRLRDELGVVLAYPNYQAGLQALL